MNVWWQRALVAMSALWIVAAHSMTLGYLKWANVDEAYASAISSRLLDGYKLYDGAVSQRGPLMYYAFTLLARLAGWDNVLAVRLAALGLSLTSFGLVVWSARRFFSSGASTVAALIMGYALGLGFFPYEAIALHGEVLLTPALLGGAALGAIALLDHPLGSHARGWRLATSGLLFATAACIKPTTLLHPIPLASWLFAQGRPPGAKHGAPWRDACALAAGFVSLPVVLLVHAGLSGTLHQLVYYTFTYNVTIHTHPLGSHHAWHHPPFRWVLDMPLHALGAAGCLGMLLTRWGCRAVRAIKTRKTSEVWAGFDVLDYFGLHFATAFLLATWLPEEFEHYFIVPLPFLALVAGELGAGVGLGTLGGVATIVTYAVVMTTNEREKSDGRVIHDVSLETTARYVADHTQPDDRIFVWGFSPWVYTYAHRRPAGRFVFITYPIGFVPWFWDALDHEQDNVVPNTMAALLADLARERPAYVVDAGSVMLARPMRAYTEPLRWLRANYCFDVRIGSYDLYRRRHPSEVCGGFPDQAPTVDFFGGPLPVRTAVDLDASDTRLLPLQDPLQPRRLGP